MQIAIAPTIRNQSYQPHPRDYLTISEGTPYVVPSNKIFVLTGLGTASLTDDAVPGLAVLSADGTVEVTGGLYGCSMLTLQGVGWVVPDTCTGAQVPTCISFAEGVSLAVTGGGGGGDARAWGFIAPE